MRKRPWFRVERPRTPPRVQDPITSIHCLARLFSNASNGGAGINSDHFAIHRGNWILLPYIPTHAAFHLPLIPSLAFFATSQPASSGGQARSSQDDGGGGVDAGAVSADGARLLLAAGHAPGVLAERRRVDGGGEQGVREGAGADRPERARPVGEGGGAAAREDGRRREEPLPRPRERRRLHRGRARAVPALQQLGPVGRVHPRGLGRRRRRRVQARRLLPQARARVGAGAQEGCPMDGGGAQAFLDGPEEVRERGLAEHLAQVRDEPDADAGGQPRAEVLHPAQLRRQGQAPVQHPRHHHRQPPRRRPRRQRPALAAVRGHHHRHRPRPGGREALHGAAPSWRRARRVAPLRQREAGAQELARGRPGLRRRLRLPADALRTVVTGGSCGENRSPISSPSPSITAGPSRRRQVVVLGLDAELLQVYCSYQSDGWHVPCDL